MTATQSDASPPVAQLRGNSSRAGVAKMAADVRLPTRAKAGRYVGRANVNSSRHPSNVDFEAVSTCSGSMNTRRRNGLQASSVHCVPSRTARTPARWAFARAKRPGSVSTIEHGQLGGAGPLVTLIERHFIASFFPKFRMLPVLFGSSCEPNRGLSLRFGGHIR